MIIGGERSSFVFTLSLSLTLPAGWIKKPTAGRTLLKCDSSANVSDEGFTKIPTFEIAIIRHNYFIALITKKRVGAFLRFSDEEKYKI